MLKMCLKLDRIGMIGLGNSIGKHVYPSKSIYSSIDF